MNTGTRMVARLLLAAAAVALVATVIPSAAVNAAPAAAGTSSLGADISWPECPHTLGIPGKRGQDKPLPPASSKFVVLGLTNGPAFFANPCLAREVSWAKNHHVYAAAYAVTTWPFKRQLARQGARGPYTTRTFLGRLSNVGYHQALFNVDTMRRAGLTSPVVWVDVEDSSLMVWPRTPRRNQAVIRGLIRGYRQSGYRVGFYSTSSIWHAILGTARYGLPEWRTAGQTSESSARSKCSSSSFQGGRAAMGQWWTTAKDYDVLCPSYTTPASMSYWFHKY